MATASAPLNAGPALAEDREKQQLPPKSYVNAVEEDAPAETMNGIHRTNGAAPTKGTNGANEIGSDDVKGCHQAAVLRIVDTGVSAVEKNETKEEQKGDRPQVERQVSKHEYSATVCPSPYLSGVNR